MCMLKGKENLVYTCILQTNHALLFLRQGILTTLDMDCVKLIPWSNFQPNETPESFMK